MAENVYDVSDVVRSFRASRQSAASGERVQALRGVTLTVRRGETLGVVGESGSGKSTFVRILLALDQADSGDVRYEGRRVGQMDAAALRAMRRAVQPVFQDPTSSLDPRMRVRDIVAEPLRSLRIAGDHAARATEVLEAVGLATDAGSRFPHQFSGGQRQRIAIARALAPQPAVIIADEPVSALDVSVRAQVLNLLAELKERFQLTLVLVSHDLSVVRAVCDRVAVMYLGRVVETGDIDDVYRSPQHPYTRLLLDAVPAMLGAPPRPLRGSVPSPRDVPPGCAFHPRCPLAFDRCLSEDPVLREDEGSSGPSRAAACHLAFTGRVETLLQEM
jgi:oligopeptide/dipeptide ABC transporter ATP-binding protein